MKPVLLDNKQKYEGPWVPVKTRNGNTERQIEAEGFQDGDIVQLHLMGGEEAQKERFLMTVSENGKYEVMFRADYIRGIRIQSIGSPVSIWVH